MNIVADNWVVALGMALGDLDRLTDLRRVACEVLPNGNAIVTDLKNGHRYVVQPEQAYQESSEDPPTDPTSRTTQRISTRRRTHEDEAALRTLDPELDLVEIDAFDSWLSDIDEAGSTIFACQAALAAAQMAVPCDSASVLMLEERGLRFVAASGPIATQLVGRYIPADAGAAGFAVQHRQLMILREIGDDPRHYRDLDKETGYQTRNLACVPVKADDIIYGVIEVLNFPENDPFSAEGIAQLERVARHLGRRLAGSSQARPHLSSASPAPEDELDERLITDEVSIEPISSSDIALALPDEDIALYQTDAD